MNIFRKACKTLIRNAPTMLTAGSCAGVIATSILTGRAVLKADRILKEIPDEDLKSFGVKKKLTRVYILPILSGSATIACIIGCHLMNKQIQAGLIAAYGIVNSTFKAWKSKLTAEEEMMIEEEIDKDRIIAALEEMLNDRPGEEYELWIDDYRKNPYWARKSDILFGKDELNRELRSPNFSRHFGTASLAEFYSHVQGEPEPQDYLYGWDIDYLLEEWDDDQLEVKWTENYSYIDPVTGEEIRCNHIYWTYDPLFNYWTYESSYDKVQKMEPRENS